MSNNNPFNERAVYIYLVGTAVHGFVGFLGYGGVCWDGR